MVWSGQNEFHAYIEIDSIFKIRESFASAIDQAYETVSLTLSLQVQVIPWVLADSNHVFQPSQRLESNKTIFVGALHGMITAEALGNIMSDLFGNVIYSGIDTDKHKYPIGMWFKYSFNKKNKFSTTSTESKTYLILC